jgi:hypothetical protein
LPDPPYCDLSAFGIPDACVRGDRTQKETGSLEVVRDYETICSSAPIVLSYAGHLGTFSHIPSMELFQTTTNAYI